MARGRERLITEWIKRSEMEVGAQFDRQRSIKI